MNYLLDTCILAELVKPTPTRKVVAWVRNRPEKTLFLSVLTPGEIQKVITKLPDSQKRTTLQLWLKRDLPQRFEGRILDITTPVAKKWGEIQAQAERVGKTMPVIDSLIAATGLVYNLIVATCNTAGMAISGVQTFNPWEEVEEQAEEQKRE